MDTPEGTALDLYVHAVFHEFCSVHVHTAVLRLNTIRQFHSFSLCFVYARWSSMLLE